jgi:RNA polymerase sigma factor (sigma-70 family)
MDADAARSQLAAALVRTGTGDRAALRQVYEDSSAKLFGILLRILKDRNEAEDVLQDVYVTVWRKAALYNPERASPITWLVAIARNRAIDRLRSGTMKSRTASLDDATNVRDTTPGALDMVVKAEQQARLGHCLSELEEKTSQAIRAAFLDGLTYEQLAEKMGVPLGTMKSWIRRGLLKLRACLEAA